MGRTVLPAFVAICLLSVISAQLLGGPENIDDLTEPGVVAAANAAVQYLNGQNSPDSKELILVRIISGTQQVINGVRYRLNIEVAEAQACLNDITSTIYQCPVNMNTVNTWVVVVTVSSGSPMTYTVESTTLAAQPTNSGTDDNTPLPGGKMVIEDFSGPHILGATCAAVDQITAMSNSVYKSILVTIKNGTYQVVNGVKYDLWIVVALSTTCKRSSDLCTTEECPVDEHTQYLWQVSVVAPPTPVNQTIDYDVISVTPLKHVGVNGGGGMKMPIQNFSDPRVMGAACAVVGEITAMSNSVYKSVLVVITSGTYQVVNGLRYDLMIEVALSTTCRRDSELCTSVECPIDEHTQSPWLASVVAPPTPLNETINYDVLSVTPADTVEDTGGTASIVPQWLAILAISLISFSI